MNEATFRSQFPEFTSTALYPSSQVTFWLGVAAKMVNADRWVDTLDLGLALFTAHNLVLERGAIAQAATGGIPTGIVGLLASKAADKLSISYDNASAMEKDAGHWNLTIFGRRYWQLLNMFGAGGVQLY